ncbi:MULTISPECIES: hypothetical protein [Cupriavidus]
MTAPTDRFAAFRRVWSVPLLVASLTLAGLLAALLGDGIWRALAWVFLAVPVLLAVRFGVLRGGG